MGSFGIFHWLIVVAVFGVVPLIPIWKIVAKAGYSGVWALLLFVPLVNIIALWVFAFSVWPSTSSRS